MASRSVRFAKRVVDVVSAAVGLAVVSPLLPWVALAIRLESKGPVLFRQRRVRGMTPASGDGLDDFECFELVKFRTMHVDAERDTGPVLASRGDPRVTRVGRFLRQTRLDELPQLWNVLRGDMSLVGPRPERPEITRELRAAIPFFEERLAVAPGLTGLAQVNLGYRGEIGEWQALWGLSESLLNPYDLDAARGALADDVRMKLLYDLAYVSALGSWRRWVATDLAVLAKTPLVVLRKLGE